MKSTGENKKSSHRLSRLNKILKKQEFLRLRDKARYLRSRHWVLYYLPNELGIPRLALTASGKYGNATERNFFRRKLRELFRLNKKVFTGFDVHFVARRASTHTTAKDKRLVGGSRTKRKDLAQEIERDFDQLLAKFPPGRS